MGRAALGSSQWRAEVTIIHGSKESRIALRSKTRRHTERSRRKMWSGPVNTEVASEPVPTPTGLLFQCVKEW